MSTAARARAWHHAAQARVCDVVRPWAHGTILRATRYPGYWDYNVVRVEEDPHMDAAELAAFADEALAGLEHRRIDVEEPADCAERLRAGFEELGWMTERLVWMRHEAPAAPGPSVAVETVPYDGVNGLREEWFEADFPGVDLGGHVAEAREVAMLRGARVLAVTEAGKAVAFAQLEGRDRSAEIVQVYVRPDRRGRGLGTAVTRAAIEAAGAVEDLWIVADDEDRPKQLYMRLGFRPLWTAVQLLRLPQSGR